MSSAHSEPAVIRRIRPDEVEVYRAFRLRALQDSPDAFSDSYALAIARPPEFWTDRVANTSEGLTTVLMVASDAETDTWLGMTGCFLPNPGDGIGLVVSVWVAPEARRQQLARRLLDGIVGWARARDLHTLTLWVVETNTRARNLYVGAGFTPTGNRHPLPSNPALQEIEMSRAI
ncbi:MAG: GNAT family N-acetyltransferase [Chloroflexota bacterium]